MAETPRLKLPLIAADQAQKHVTHNEAILMLDLLTGTIPALDRSLTSPPDASDGDVHILGGTGTGGWAGFGAGDLALRLDGAWRRVLPSIGMIASIAAEDGRLVYYNGSWMTIGHPVPLHTGQINLLINGAFTVNQRGFAGGALAAGDYGHDRWKAGTGGASYSVTGGVVSHASGPLVQIIESPGLAGEVVTVSVENLAGGDLAVDVAGVTGVISPGAGRRAVTLTVPPAATGNIAVTLAPASGAVTYRRVQFNEGGEALPFERRHIASELWLCRRYYFESGVGLIALNKQREFDRARSMGVSFQTTMRATPAITLTGVNTGGHDGVNVANQTPVGFRAVSAGAGTDGSQPFFTGYIANAEL